MIISLRDIKLQFYHFTSGGMIVQESSVAQAHITWHDDHLYYKQIR